TLILPSLPGIVSTAPPELIKQDAAFLLGADLSAEVARLSAIDYPSKEITTKDWCHSASVGDSNIQYLHAPPSDTFSTPQLWEAVRSKLDENADLKPSRQRDAYENISYLLPILHDVIDREQRPEGDVRRLFRGLSYADFLLLLNSYGASATPIA